MPKSYKKICPQCWLQHTKKDGIMRKKQRYRCNTCKHIWLSKSRTKDNNTVVYEDRALHKQTYGELANKYSCSIRTIQRTLDAIELTHYTPTATQEIILLVDTTYFWKIGVMVFKDVETTEILHYRIVDYETNKEYKAWIEHLQQEWRTIKAIVCDWRRWLLWWFDDIPTQMCHFHQKQIIRRNITQNPILEPNKELKKIVDQLPHIDKKHFKIELLKRYNAYKDFIWEKWLNAQWKSYYIHRKTRSAYFSLKRNFEYLFIYLDYVWTINIPNTTNWLEWLFGHLKYKVALHRWLREDRKLKLINYLLNYRKKPHTFVH